MKKAKRFLTGLLSAALALSLCAMPAMADDGSEAPTTTPTTTTTESVINPNQTGSITIYKYLQTKEVSGEEGTGEEQNVTTNDVTSALPGAGFTVYQVMNTQDLVNYYNGNSAKPQPKVEDYFEKNDDGETVKSYTEKDLIANKVTAIEEGKEQFTDPTGKVTFKPLPVGLYLVIETTPPESVVSAVTPFLVSIPMTRVKTEPEKEGQLKEWLYDVTVYPKNSTKTGNISLIKKGVTGNDKKNGVALSGVQFQLQWYNDASNAADKWEDVDVPKATGTEGKIEFEGLKKGTYRVKEIGYANGATNKSYVINKDATFEFKVDENGTIQYVTPPTGNEDFVISTADNTITVYNYKPDIDKQVQDRGTDNWVEASDYSVGDEVPYKITVTVPKNIEKMRTFKVTDTPTNLKYVEGSMNVVADPAEKKVTLKENTDYTLDTTNPANGFTVSFDTSKLTAYVGKTIEISYKAKLLQTAVTTEKGNDNKARLIYSNTTDTTGGGKNTITDSAFVYTFKIEVIKQDENGKKLDGVEFDLYREVSGTPGKKGTLTSADAKALGLEEVQGKAWLKVNQEKLVTDKNGKIDLTKRLTDDAFNKGDFTNVGLSNGRYALVETKTKENYNLLKGPIYVTLNVQYTKTWTSVTETVDGDGNITKDKSTQTFQNASGETLTGTREQVIINRKGFKLPTTGGFGTLLFSGIGVLLVVAGVGVLLSLKKKNRT